jgi:hypothetical protein
MAQFLTSEWIAALDAAAQGSNALAQALDHDGIVVQQVVRSHSGDEIIYHLALEAGRPRVHEGAAPAPDLTLVTDYDAARSLHRGERNAQAVLEAGQLKLRGTPEALVGRSALFAALGDVFAVVRASTTFPE